jgi:hypothetical protein
MKYKIDFVSKIDNEPNSQYFIDSFGDIVYLHKISNSRYILRNFSLKKDIIMPGSEFSVEIMKKNILLYHNNSKKWTLITKNEKKYELGNKKITAMNDKLFIAVYDSVKNKSELLHIASSGELHVVNKYENMFINDINNVCDLVGWRYNTKGIEFFMYPYNGVYKKIQDSSVYYPMRNKIFINNKSEICVSGDINKRRNIYIVKNEEIYPIKNFNDKMYLMKFSDLGDILVGDMKDMHYHIYNNGNRLRIPINSVSNSEIIDLGSTGKILMKGKKDNKPHLFVLSAY